MLETEEINVYYGDLQALWQVSIQVSESEIVTLVGSNGAGKSTFLRTLSGLLRPKRGRILFDGVRLDKVPAHKIVRMGICMVPEGRRIWPEMNVLENLEVGAYHSKARRIRDQTIKWIYEIFPVLKARADQAAGTMSGGEQQMLAIGRALMSQPRVLLIDEMSLGLSPLLVQEFAKVIRALNQNNRITILLVEQNVRMALALADRGYILENGRIVKHGHAQELLTSDDVKTAYLGIKPLASEG
jgi:branched-chain amino acid transport system ATP-binding protein